MYCPAAQAAQKSMFDAVENVPAAHFVQVVAPAKEPVFVIDPGVHVMQRFAPSEPLVPTYLPALQSVHDATFDAIVNLPAAHSVHEVAPVLVPAFVIDPAAQVVHDATFDAVEYLPAAHAVHAVAPVDAPVSVIEPATHTLQ